jgi:lauroyl/myristoyl acyltransferase
MRSTKSARISISALVVFHLIRFLERIFSPGMLYRTFAFIAWVRPAFKRQRSARPVPECLGGEKQIQASRQPRWRSSLNRVLQFFPDRLAIEKWRGRLQLDGAEYLETARKQKRPIVLAFCHFGPFSLLRYWLRTVGIPASTLVRGQSEDRSEAKRLQDRVSPFPEIPTALYHENQLRDAVKFLASGNPMLVAIDVLIGKQMDVPVDQQWQFTMATGAIRLAVREGAELIPCSIADVGEWWFQIKLGPPVPRELLQAEEILSAGKHLIEAMLPEFQKYPEQCSDRLLSLFRRTDSSNDVTDECSHSGRLVAG